MSGSGYIGRFAPSPTGRLHIGSLLAALASYADAKAHGGRWLLRVEDVDTPRCVPGADAAIARQLAACGLLPDEPPLHQSARSPLYAQALAQLTAAQLAYGCACTRKEIAAFHAARGTPAVRGAEQPYPGICRPENGGLQNRPPRAWRLHTGRCEAQWLAARAAKADAAAGQGGDAPAFDITEGRLHWHDRRLGAQQQNVQAEVGDFVLRRADGLWAYQLAVVVDDAAQGITHVVRGEDLADNTPRQLLLQAALGLPTPAYLHTPLVCAANGEKLSKQNGATALQLDSPHDALAALQAAASQLGLPPAPQATVAEALAGWVRAWAALWL